MGGGRGGGGAEVTKRGPFRENKEKSKTKKRSARKEKNFSNVLTVKGGAIKAAIMRKKKKSGRGR